MRYLAAAAAALEAIGAFTMYALVLFAITGTIPQ